MKKTVFILLLFVNSLSFGKTAKYCNNSGVSNGILKDSKGAIEDYTKAIELNPKF